jgi:hypothetical protein
VIREGKGAPHREKFNLVHIVPNESLPAAHGLLGYTELVDTLHWGLVDIGFTTTRTANSFAADKINIVLGAQMLPDAELCRLPPNTIIYNFEQIARTPVDRLKPEIRTIGERFRVWEYSEANIATWSAIGTRYPVTLVPVGWAPVLKRIDPNKAQDIEVLIYGLPGQLRLEVFSDLCLRGLKCVFLCGLYGQARDNFIARSKLVLNINQHESRIFEVVRVSYLLANAKAVIADAHADMLIEPDIKGAVVFCQPRDMFQMCWDLLHDDEARLQLGLRGQSAFQARHISPILRSALERMPVV